MMPNIARTFDEKQYKQVKSKFQNDLITIFPKFSKALREKKSLDKDFELSEYIADKIKTDYAIKIEHDTFDKVVDLVSGHYKAKFAKTKEPKFNIVTFCVGDKDCESSSESSLSSVDSKDQADYFEELITNNMPETKNPQGIVFYSNTQEHATPALLTHDKKIIMFNLFNVDSHITSFIKGYITSSNLDTEILSCQSVFNNCHYNDLGVGKNNPQRDNISCVIFAHKYLKLLCEDEYKLFKTMQLSPNENSVYVFPPELLRYSQSDRLVENTINEHSKILHLSKDQKEDITKKITDYRDKKFGKFRILYHHIKNYTGNKNKKSEMIENLKTLTTDLELENFNLEVKSLLQEH